MYSSKPRVLADYYRLTQPHEQDLYQQIGASFKATGTFPFASAGDWERKMIEKYTSKTREVTNAMTKTTRSAA